MTGNNRHLATLTVNVNGLSAPIKRHRIENWVKKQDPTICCLKETEKNKHCLESKGGKKFSKQMNPINWKE
jgi:exonuclease III